MIDSTVGRVDHREQLSSRSAPPSSPTADSSERNGVIIGGAALWLIDSGDEAINDAAWQFMKFMAEDRAADHLAHGLRLLPGAHGPAGQCRTAGILGRESQLPHRHRPAGFTTPTTLADGTPNYAVLGGRAGPFPAIRRIIVEAYSRVLDDGLTPQEALDEAAEKANAELENYNAFFE